MNFLGSCHTKHTEGDGSIIAVKDIPLAYPFKDLALKLEPNYEQYSDDEDNLIDTTSTNNNSDDNGSGDHCIQPLANDVTGAAGTHWSLRTLKGRTAFPEEILGFQATPAADHLFDIRDPQDARPLPEEQAHAFHHMAAKLLFLSACAHCDIQPVTAFLTTRIKAPDEDDWGKVKRLLQYLKCTVHMPLILSAESLTLARWWVDAAYTVHTYCRSNTGAGMSLGQSMAMSYSWKQKINTKSSTEAELVGVDDSLGYILWARYFLLAQGYDMQPSLVYQDNMSAILLETNGKASSTK